MPITSVYVQQRLCVTGLLRFVDTVQECGGVVHSISGQISSPDSDGDGQYDTNVDCLWKIQAPEGQVIRFTLNEVNIEWSESCDKDFLAVS